MEPGCVEKSAQSLNGITFNEQRAEIPLIAVLYRERDRREFKERGSQPPQIAHCAATNAQHRRHGEGAMRP